MKDILILIPSEVLGYEEPGEPLRHEVVDIIRAMAVLRYAPVDFGEASIDATELWFETVDSISHAQNRAEHFIALGGDV